MRRKSIVHSDSTRSSDLDKFTKVLSENTRDGNTTRRFPVTFMELLGLA